MLLLIPETLRRIAGNGEVPLEHWYYRPLLWSFLQNSRTPNRNLEDQTAPRTVSAEIKPAKPFSFKIFIRPFKLLCEWDALCALLFGGCVYTAWSMMVASTTYLLKDIYQFSTIQWVTLEGLETIRTTDAKWLTTAQNRSLFPRKRLRLHHRQHLCRQISQLRLPTRGATLAIRSSHPPGYAVAQ